MGKRKIVIEEIKDNRLKRSVTFTKRRDGLFKKAETACLKFGLQIGIVAFSPAGKPFTFTNSSSSLSVDAIINTYMSSCCSSSSTSSAVVMGKRSRSDEDDDVQVIETEKKKKQKTMNAVVTPPPPCSITVVEEEKLDEGFHWDHYKNLDSDQTHHHDQDLRNEFMGYGENVGIIVTEEVIEGESSHSWAPDVQEIINVEDDDFEYDADHHHHHDDDETTTMGLLPPPPPPHTTTTSTSLCNSVSASDVNEDEEVGGANEDDGFTLEEWENILNSSPTVGDSSVVGNSTFSSSCMNQDVNWPTQEFLHLLCS